MKNIFEKLLDFIYKKKCYFCSKSNESVRMCSKCYDELTFADIRVSRAIEGVDVYCAGIYEKTLQKMIRGIKYHRQKELAYYAAKFLWEYFKQTNLTKDYQVVPVPLHKTRIRKRGYNHMELIADEFCALSGFIPNYKIIERIKNTKPQYKLSREEKFKNLENAFSVNIEKDLKKPVLLIDDICTSGATFSSMIKELKSCGIEDITCLALSTPV